MYQSYRKIMKMQEISRLCFIYLMWQINSTVAPVTVTPVTYIRPDILIFTGVTHKEGKTSDSIKPHVVNHGILTKLISLNHLYYSFFFLQFPKNK